MKTCVEFRCSNIAVRLLMCKYVQALNTGCDRALLSWVSDDMKGPSFFFRDV